MSECSRVNITNLVEVNLLHRSNFLKVKETLTRVGKNDGNNGIEQVCYILSKQGKYFITHINELRSLDNENVTVTDKNIAVRNLVIHLLIDWKLIEVINPSVIKHPVSSIKDLKIVSYKEKSLWKLISKYQIGKKYNIL